MEPSLCSGRYQHPAAGGKRLYFGKDFCKPYLPFINDSTMVPALRKAFNAAFTRQRYEAFLQDLNGPHPGAIEFRIAETPVFVPKDFGKKLTDACEAIVDLIVDPDFKKL